MKKIVVIGSTNVDLVAQVKDMPLEGETVISNSFGIYPGGKGANQAFACGRLEGETAFLSVIGSDGMGDSVISGIKKAGVDISHVKVAQSTPTGQALIWVNKKGNNSIVVVPGANEKCDKEYILENKAVIDEGDIILIQMEISQYAVYYAVELAKKSDKLTILNPAPAQKDIPQNVYEMLDYITPNETELGILTDMPVGTREEILCAAKNLLQRGVKNVVVTLGAQGAMFMNSNGYVFFNAWPGKAVDTTAAGDTFNAGMAVQLARGASIEEAITFANAASAIVVTRKGAQTSVPSRQEVEEFMLENKDCGGHS